MTPLEQVRAELDHGEIRRLSEQLSPRGDFLRNQAAEDGLQLGIGVKVAGHPKRVVLTPVVAEPGMVERERHEAAERHGAAGRDCSANLAFQFRHAR